MKNYLAAFIFMMNLFVLISVPVESVELERFKSIGTAIDENNFPLALVRIKNVLSRGDVSVEDKRTVGDYYFQMGNVILPRSFDQANQYYKSALELLPENKEFIEKYEKIIFQQADKFQEKRNYDDAKRLYHNLLLRDNENAIALIKYGEVYALQQNLQVAKKKFLLAKDILIRKGADLSLVNNRIEDLEKEMLIREDQKQFSFRKFTLLLDENCTSREVVSVSEDLDLIYKSVTNDINYFPREKVVAHLYSDKQFQAQVGGIHRFVAGQYDGKMRIPDSFKNINRKYFRALLAHEFTHALVHDLTAGNCPRWLNEGLSVYQERRFYEVPLNVLNDRIQKDQVLSLADLYVWNFSYSEQTRTSLFYEQAYSVVKFLINKKGMAQFKRFLSSFSENSSFEASIKKYYGISLERLEREWRWQFPKLRKVYQTDL